MTVSEILQQMGDDVEKAVNMTDMTTSQDVRALVNRLNTYRDLISREIANRQHEIDIFKGKIKTLDNFIQNGKQFATELSITSSQDRKVNNY